MKIKNPTIAALLPMVSLLGLITIIILAAAIPNSVLFQGNLSLRPAASEADCKYINLKSIPSPIRSNQNAILVIEAQPANWQGKFRVSASSGLVTDSSGNNGSYIESEDKILLFGGGDEKSSITVQATGEGNEQCIGVVEVVGAVEETCSNLSITSSKSPLYASESTELIINTVPEHFAGTFLIEAESGKFLLSSADSNADGENTNIVVTANKKVIYTGGKSGEKLKVLALGANNVNCKDTLAIAAK